MRAALLTDREEALRRRDQLGHLTRALLRVRRTGIGDGGDDLRRREALLTQRAARELCLDLDERTERGVSVIERDLARHRFLTNVAIAFAASARARS
jgi:hypothetical protein